MHCICKTRLSENSAGRRSRRRVLRGIRAARSSKAASAPTPAAPVAQPLTQFQFTQPPNPTPDFFEDIPFVKAVNEIAPSRLEEIVEYEDEEDQQPVTQAPRRRPAPLTVPKKFHAGIVSNDNDIPRGDRVKVLDRYSHRNEDGSFTWGYQSSDGSFKEETIGNDCITKGR